MAPLTTPRPLRYCHQLSPPSSTKHNHPSLTALVHLNSFFSLKLLLNLQNKWIRYYLSIVKLYTHALVYAPFGTLLSFTLFPKLPNVSFNCAVTLTNVVLLLNSPNSPAPTYVHVLRIPPNMFSIVSCTGPR